MFYICIKNSKSDEKLYIGSSSDLKKGAGFTLVETLVGIFLILIVFLGIFGAYQLGLKVVGLSKNKITATAIANGQLEQIRNLSYESIGVQGEFPDGVLEKVSTVISNNIEYKIETRVDFIIDSADGISAPEDECFNDYKRVETKVSWSGRFEGEVKLVTDASPKNLAQECAIGGGILSVSVFNAQGIMVFSPLIEVKDLITDQTIKTATPIEGKHYFSLPALTYKVIVSKDGYSQERTYGTDEIATPEKPHSIVLEGQMTEISFSIDKLSSFSVDTLFLWGTGSFSDSFLDESKISQSSNLTISGGEVKLLKIDSQYESSGYLVSITILPANLIKWDEFSFSDSEPAGTEILYQFLYFDGANWVLIPDSDLPGNSLGFGVSPVDLSSLNTATYSQLRLKGNFSTSDPSLSPILFDWQISWINSEATPITNLTFNLKGTKIIGTDSNENLVYKYSQNHISGPNGHIDILNLEWDSYNFSVDPATGLDLIQTDPSPQPIDLPPDVLQKSVKLYLQAENSLLLTVQNIVTLEPVFSANARLYNVNLGYDTTQYTNEKGQTYFIPLQPATYNLEVAAPGYSTTSNVISVSGDEIEIIKIEQIE